MAGEAPREGDPGDISVIIPAYQAAATIGRAMRSVGAQTLRPRELIVIDDGSTDGTLAMAEDAAKALAGIDVTLLRQNNLGAGAARNAGLEAAGGGLVAFLDADDEWLPEKLSRSLDQLRESGADLVAHDYLRIEPAGAARIDCTRHFEAARDPFVSYVLRGYIATSTVVARRELLLQAGGFDPSLHAGQDYELWLVVISTPGVTHKVFAEALTRYYVVADSITSQVRQRRAASLTILWRHLRRLQGPGRQPTRVALERALIINIQAICAHLARRDLRGLFATLVSIPTDLVLTCRHLAAAPVERPDFLGRSPARRS